MDFLNMDFSTLFLEKHGRATFDNITKQIKIENSNKYSQDYVEVVFKFALLDFWGLREYQIKRMLEDIISDQKINIVEIKSIHKQSVAKIKKYLQSELGKVDE